MPTGIYMKGAKNVLLQDVVIRGFEKGIIAEDSEAFLNRVTLRDNIIGIETLNSRLTIVSSRFENNVIDLLMKKKTEIEKIDTAMHLVLDVTSSASSIEAINVQSLARQVLYSKDLTEKKRALKRLEDAVERYSTIKKTVGEVVFWLSAVQAILWALHMLGVIH
ncbi:hypothetical protein [Thermococcus sp. LS2]|uniref:hypothetical protein n=1 Tax=Thermococcus sp. LS2 TaxID=1638260 RepID=UPI00143B60FF|nr:hypothetical protein [Thermococcus sp. LS2]NJE13752.1 hypothetical protein [Thermococcus sp. LS2]